MELPALDEVFRAHGVAVAYLFGSRVDGRARPGSDHDVAVLFAAAEPPLDATVRLGADLAAVLGTPVDVVDLDRAPLELRGRVAEQGRRLFSGDEVRRVRLEVDARVRWPPLRLRLWTITGPRLAHRARQGWRAPGWNL